jgi:hypothetical protein
MAAAAPGGPSSFTMPVLIIPAAAAAVCPWHRVRIPHFKEDWRRRAIKTSKLPLFVSVHTGGIFISQTVQGSP